jgi:GntR family transcriptional regulator
MSDPMPLYRKIAEDLRGQINAGELAPGDRLGSEAELMEKYGQDGKASRNTVRDAIKLLVGLGLVETRAGQGTFVVTKMQPFLTRLTQDPESGGFEDEVFRSEVQRQGREPEETTPRVEVQPASARVASRLAVEEGTPVISRHQERSIDGTPWSLQTIFYPMEFATEGGATDLLKPDDMSGGHKEGVLKYLESTLGIRQAGWRDMIIARPPRRHERDFFGLSDKALVAIFEFQRTSYGEDGKPIRFAVTVYPADRNQFEMEAGRVPAPDTTTPDASASTKSSAGWEDEPFGNGSPDDKALDSAAGS